MRLLTSAVALLLLAGCGGGKTAEKGSATPKPTATATATQAADTMPADQWAQRVETRCQKLSKQSYRAGVRFGRQAKAKGLSKQQLTAGTLLLEAKLLKPWVDELDGMPRPEGKEDLLDAFVADMRKTGTLLRTTAKAILANDETSGRKAIGDLQSVVTRSRSEVRDLGIEKCNPPAGSLS